MMSFWANIDHGQTAPNHMKMAKLRSMSIVGCSESSMVSRRNQSLVQLVKIECLCEDHILLGKYVASYKAGKKIVGPYQTTGTNNKKLRRFR